MMGKTKHYKTPLRNFFTRKERKEYQDNERPKNKPSGMFYKYGVDGVIRGEQVVGHQSGGEIKKRYSRILRKKIKEETHKLIEEGFCE